MTVCIGLLCADRNGKPESALVLASDRLVTRNGVGFEYTMRKMRRISDKCVIMVAGSAGMGEVICHDVELSVNAAIAGNIQIEIPCIAQLTADVYKKIRLMRVQNEVFDTRGIALQAFYAGTQEQPNSYIAKDIDKQVTEYNLEVSLLVAGYDNNGAHLYFVGNPGNMPLPCRPGNQFTAGEGSTLAQLSLWETGFHGESLRKTILAAYIAKCRSERANSVGAGTDMMVIDQDGAREMTEADLGSLKASYIDYDARVKSAYSEVVSQCTMINIDPGPQGGSTEALNSGNLSPKD